MLKDPTVAPSAYAVQQALSVAQAFVSRLRETDPDIDTDEAALMSALESETDATEILVRVLRAGEEAGAMAEATKMRIDALRTRENRWTKRKADARGTAFAIMDALALPKFVSADFTASIRPGSAGVVITDEAVIPAELMRQAAAVPDKDAIKRLLKAGEIVPGAELQNSMPTLSVRAA